MGSEAKSNKVPLVEFLYKDKYLIDSFYAQVFQGNLSQLTTSEGTKNTTKAGISAGIKGFIEGGIDSNDEVSDEVQKYIDPHDFKISKLIEEIAPQISGNDFRDSQLIRVSGTISIMCKEYINTVIEPLKRIGVLDELYSTPTNMKASFGKNRGDLGMETLLHAIIEMIPLGVTGILTTEDQDLLCALREECLMTPATQLTAIFGSKLPGKFTVIGITNSKNNVSIEDVGLIAGNGNFAKAILAFEDAPKSILSVSGTSWIINPIVIYREIEY